MMLLKSLTSKGHATEVYNWQWYYYSITQQGVTFLCKKLGKDFQLTCRIPI
jgi:hypothetical protein